ncbi:ABC transporter substrate-binding protein [Kiloniella laminariae]|uniref:ABC transporter substrate-binding protein n=1 Tax=Kiloniella laminariae TaxID=454162 RepID=A0ABT4LEE0_9PROT|nr:ABC transporter substrate-binding protein [Kiloniella laminariae]MCZ4279467.1 ABC transporter substrate-binding protein [Kiloniella laminariae]
MKNVLFAAVAALSVTAMTPAQAVERGGTLTFARYDDSTLIDPIYADRNPDIWMVSNLYDTLLRTEADGKTVVPGLASSYSLSSDGLELKMTLREGIRFSDGSDIEAQDVIFSLERARNPDLGPWAGLLGSIESVTANDRDITITLKNPDPTIILMLATFNTAIVSKDAFDTASGTTDQEKAQALSISAPVGSGPFVLKDHQRGASMNFVANRHYWRQGEDGQPLPYLDAIDFLVIPDDATRILKLQAGEVDAAEFIPFARVAELKADSNINMELFPSTRIIYSPINTREKTADGEDNILASKEARQALNYATNKEALIQLILHGAGKPMTSGLMASTTQLATGTEPLYKYDLEKAKALAAKAGIKPGTEISLTTLAGSADDAIIFTALQQMWSQIGIKLSVEQVDGATRGAKNRSGEFDIHTYGWVNDVNDPAQVAGWLGYYPTRKAVGTDWNNAEFNSLYEASNKETNLEKRAEQYAKMQTLYAEEAPLIFMYETPFAVALGNAVKGYVQTPLGSNEFSSTWIEQ